MLQKGVAGKSWWYPNWRVDNVNTFLVGLRLTAFGLVRFPYVRGFPAFARPGMQFESHLGHGMSPRQRGFCFNVLTWLVVASL